MIRIPITGVYFQSFNASTGSISYIISEDWEAANPEMRWNIQNNTNSVDMYYSASVIEGSRSLHVTASGDGGSPPYVFHNPIFTTDDCNVFFLFKALAGPIGDDYAREIAWIVDYPANAHLMAIYFRHISANNYSFRIDTGGGGDNKAVSASFGLNTNVGVWLRYRKGTGTNGHGELWWAPAGDLNNIIKPASGSYWYVESTNGGYTTSANNVQFGALANSGQWSEVVYDRIRVSDVVIGDNPI